MRQVNQATLDLIKSFESLRLKPYLDSVGIPTIGYGTTRYPNGQKVSISDPSISEEQAVNFLMHDLAATIQLVSDAVKVPVNDNQFGALVSFTYNLGIGSLRGSSLLKDINAGNADTAADEFLKWDHAGGRVVAGLTRRRQAERSLFLQPVAPITNVCSVEDSRLVDLEKDI